MFRHNLSSNFVKIRIKEIKLKYIVDKVMVATIGHIAIKQTLLGFIVSMIENRQNMFFYSGMGVCL